MGLAAVAAHKLGGILSVGTIFKASIKVGRSLANRTAGPPQLRDELRVLR
jgi:hypothetical protein